MSNQVNNPDSIGARRVVGKRKHGLAWLPWLALLLLALIAIGIYLLLQNVNDNNDKAGIDVSDDEVSTPVAPSSASSKSPVTTSTSSKTASAGSIVSSSGTDLLTAAQNKTLSSLASQPVTATSALVNSVVADEGFWVGNQTNQVFVHLTAQAKGNGESGVQVLPGQHVDFAGVLTKNPADVSTLGVSDSEGAAQLASEGYYVNATTFKIQ